MSQGGTLFLLPRERAYGQNVPEIPWELSHITGQGTVPFTNEPQNPQPLPLEPLKVEEIKEPLESVEMAAERIEILDPVEAIQPMKKPESEITLKKLEPYELVKPTILDELMEPLGPLKRMLILIETPMMFPEVE